MYLNRKTSYLLAILLVLLFFFIGALFLNTGYQKSSLAPTTPLENQDQVSQSTLPSDEPPLKKTTHEAEIGDMSEQPAEGFALENFHRSETRDGKVLWEVTGQNARYFPEENRIDIDACLFFTNDEKGQKIVLKANEATLILKGPELQSVFFPKDVRVTYGREMRIVTSEASYDHKKALVSTSAHVQVIGNWFIVEGDGLHARLDIEQYKILRNVTSILEPKKRRG